MARESARLESRNTADATGSRIPCILSDISNRTYLLMVRCCREGGFAGYLNAFTKRTIVSTTCRDHAPKSPATMESRTSKDRARSLCTTPFVVSATISRSMAERTGMLRSLTAVSTAIFKRPRAASSSATLCAKARIYRIKRGPALTDVIVLKTPSWARSILMISSLSNS